MNRAITMDQGAPPKLWAQIAPNFPETQDGWFFYVLSLCPGLKPDTALLIAGEILVGLSKGSLQTVEQIRAFVGVRCRLPDQNFLSGDPTMVQRRQVSAARNWSPSAVGPQNSLPPMQPRLPTPPLQQYIRQFQTSPIPNTWHV